MFSSDAPSPLRASHLGVGSMLFEASGPLGAAVQQQIWSVAAAAEKWEGVQEVVPGMNNLMVVFDPLRTSSQRIADQVHAAAGAPTAGSQDGKLIELPTVYGGEFGPDLAEVAALSGLEVSEAVRLHASAVYSVYFLGAHPGFAYLAGLDPRLHIPRRREPRMRVPAGTVAIGGAQTGAIAQTSPSGWQLIGKTDVVFFDASNSRPALLSPGDRVRFQCIGIET